MNWTKIVLGGVAAGIVMNLSDFVMHGFIMSATYLRYPEVFAQDQANPMHFFLVSICIALMAAILFGKTRSAWADGVMGGVKFGFYVGLVAFFANFYNPMVIEGFPYHLAWCWGGINVITALIGGAVLGAIYKTA